MKCGFICLAGRPNVGKSTLMNALVDADVAITSSKPETTRKAIRAILTRHANHESMEGVADDDKKQIDDGEQFIFVDTPGIHRPKTLLGKRLNAMVDEQVTAVDVILFLSPADEKLGPGDRRIIHHMTEVASGRIKLLAVLTKCDKVSREKLLERLLQLQNAAKFEEIIPVSAKTDENLERLLETIARYLPESEQLYPDDVITDESKCDMISEAVREAALEKLHQELPHSLTVQVNEIVEAEDTEAGNLEIFCNLFVERDSQKGIILGKKGANISRIRSQAQRSIREMLDNPTAHLNLSVKVAKEWQSDPKLLEKFGF